MQKSKLKPSLSALSLSALSVHLNVILVQIPGEKKTWWFGGGTDLTPTYLNRDDAKHFHSTLKVSSKILRLAVKGGTR